MKPPSGIFRALGGDLSVRVRCMGPGGFEFGAQATSLSLRGLRIESAMQPAEGVTISVEVSIAKPDAAPALPGVVTAVEDGAFRIDFLPLSDRQAEVLGELLEWQRDLEAQQALA